MGWGDLIKKKVKNRLERVIGIGVWRGNRSLPIKNRLAIEFNKEDLYLSSKK